MTLNLNIPDAEAQLKPRITVVGVGGAGGNAVNNMIQSNLEGVEFVVANTDSQAIAQSHCSRTLQLGRNITQGLGSGSRPDVGRAAAEEALEEILADLDGAHMVFITAGMGGGTGTGGAPVIARAAREQGILTVGVVTKPFHFEGVHRMRIAEAGIQELTQFVDTLIIIPNQNLFRIANEKTTFADAFKMADDVLHAGVRGVTDLMVMPGLINLDFADIRTVMTEMGKAMMGTGEAEGDNRAIAAAEAAISNPLLEDVSMKGARGVLINITGGPDLTLFEVDEAANRIRDEVDPDANIIFGSTYDADMDGKMRVSVVSTGIEADEASRPKPLNLSLVSKDSLPYAGLPRPIVQPAPPVQEETVPAKAPQPAPAPARTEAGAQPVAPQPATQVAPQPTQAQAPATPVATPVAAPATPTAPGTAAFSVAAPAQAPVVSQAAPVATAPASAAVAAQAVAVQAAPLPAPQVLAEPAPIQAGVPAPESKEIALELPDPMAEVPEPAAPGNDAFVAPAPMEPLSSAPGVLAPEIAGPAPVVERPIPAGTGQVSQQAAPAASQPQDREPVSSATRSRAQAILARMSGAARALQAAAHGQDPAPAAQPALMQEPQPQVQPEVETVSSEGTTEPQLFRAEAASGGEDQARLTNLDPAERALGASAEDDLLDIPAFLRRQAN